MQEVKEFASSCCPAATPQKSVASNRLPIYLVVGGLGLVLWWLLYSHLEALSRFITYSVLPFEDDSHLGAAVAFFLYDTPKVLMLLTLVVFGAGIVRSFFTPERTRDLLSGKRAIAGNIAAAGLGVLTPFCTCSAVPLFIGFVTAGVPLGVTFSFLIAAPMVNEIAVGLLYGLVGWKVAALYMATGLGIAISAGWVIGRLKLENYIEDWVRQVQAGDAKASAVKMTWQDRIEFGWESVKEILGRVWLFMILGIAIGAGIHGFVPEGFMASIMGKNNWWSVPAAVAVGIPMYSSAAGIIPVVEALLGKGAALGSVLAFMMSVIALSLPEMIILRKVLKPRLIATFIAVVGSGILMVGYLFNVLI